MNTRNILLTGGLVTAGFISGYVLGSSSNVNLNASLEVSSQNSPNLEKKLASADSKTPNTTETQVPNYPITSTTIANSTVA